MKNYTKSDLQQMLVDEDVSTIKQTLLDNDESFLREILYKRYDDEDIAYLINEAACRGIIDEEDENA